MSILRTPRSEILYHSGEMFKVLARHRNENYSKEKLGHLVKFYGGDKILMKDNLLIICEIVKDAQIDTA